MNIDLNSFLKSKATPRVFSFETHMKRDPTMYATFNTKLPEVVIADFLSRNEAR